MPDSHEPTVIIESCWLNVPGLVFNEQGEPQHGISEVKDSDAGDGKLVLHFECWSQAQAFTARKEFAMGGFSAVEQYEIMLQIAVGDVGCGYM